MIDERHNQKGWGYRVMPLLDAELKNELPEIKGFTGINQKFMVQFYKEYHELQITKLPVSQFENADHQIGKLPVSQVLSNSKVAEPKIYES